MLWISAESWHLSWVSDLFPPLAAVVDMPTKIMCTFRKRLEARKHLLCLDFILNVK